MRTDVKVGITIAVILVVVGVVWYAVFYHGDKTPKGQPPGDSQVVGTPGETERTNVVETEQTPPPVLPPMEIIRPAYEETTPRPVLTPPAEEVAAGRSEWENLVPSRPERTTPSWTPAEETVAPRPWGAGQPQTYLVKSGDTYSSIAQKLWGRASLHPHLQKANPNIGPRELRPRMTIKVPSRPTPTVPAAGATVAAAKHGTTGVDPVTGKRFYIIKKGDNGFWDVSKAVYGEGKHFKLIESANPGLNPRKLRAGRKVWYPEKPVRVAVGPSEVAPSPVVGPGPTTRPAPRLRGVTGAPLRAVLPDGSVFD